MVKVLLEDGAVVLVSPDEYLSDGANGLHQQVPVAVGYRRVLSQDMVHIPRGRREGGREKKRREKRKGRDERIWTMVENRLFSVNLNWHTHSGRRNMTSLPSHRRDGMDS